jgi:hypothetical protein
MSLLDYPFEEVRFLVLLAEGDDASSAEHDLETLAAISRRARVDLGPKSPEAQIVLPNEFDLLTVDADFPADIEPVVKDALIFFVSSGIARGAYQLLKTWVDAKNGRKLRLKIGDVEVEATQMDEGDVMRILELLEERSDRKKARELLLQAYKDQNPKGS